MHLFHFLREREARRERVVGEDESMPDDRASKVYSNVGTYRSLRRFGVKASFQRALRGVGPTRVNIWPAVITHCEKRMGR